MTDSTRALVAQLREALGCVVQCDDVGLTQTNATIEQARTAIAAADQWLDAPPTNQCGETCERAKLCATCARGLEQPEQWKRVSPVHRNEVFGDECCNFQQPHPRCAGTLPSHDPLPPRPVAAH